jgi:hypothetical protein
MTSRLTIGATNSSLYTGNINYVDLSNAGLYWNIPLDGISSQGQDLGLQADSVIIDTSVLLDLFTCKPRSTYIFHCNSGTNSLALPESVASAIYATIDGSSRLRGSNGIYSYPCSCVPSVPTPINPDLTFPYIPNQHLTRLNPAHLSTFRLHSAASRTRWPRKTSTRASSRAMGGIALVQFRPSEAHQTRQTRISLELPSVRSFSGSIHPGSLSFRLLSLPFLSPFSYTRAFLSPFSYTRELTGKPCHEHSNVLLQCLPLLPSRRRFRTHRRPERRSGAWRDPHE